MKKSIGKRIRKLRKQKGFSQEEMADKLHISRSAYERIENGKSNSWAGQLENLSRIFEIPPEEFLKENRNQQGSVAWQINGSREIINQLNEKVIELLEARLAEKESIINTLQQQIHQLENSLE